MICFVLKILSFVFVFFIVFDLVSVFYLVLIYAQICTCQEF